jgi:hypothetical protein
LSSNSQTTIEKVALNSLKKMIPGLSLISIFPKELFTSMVYMGVKVTKKSKIFLRRLATDDIVMV